MKHVLFYIFQVSSMMFFHIVSIRFRIFSTTGGCPSGVRPPVARIRKTSQRQSLSRSTFGDPGRLRTRRKTPFPWAVPILVDTFPGFFAEAMNTPQNRRLDPKNGIIWGLSYGARNSNNRGMLMWLIGIIHIYQ